MQTDLQNNQESKHPLPTDSDVTGFRVQNDVNGLATFIDNEVSKKYLRRLTDFPVQPPDNDIKNTDQISMFQIERIMYTKGEHIAQKLTSVINSFQHLDATLFLVLDNVDGSKTDFYMGVGIRGTKRTPEIWRNALENALHGHFPGIKTKQLKYSKKKDLLLRLQENKAISSVSCTAQNRDEEMKDGEAYTQGLENLVRAMQGKKYTAIILAEGKSAEETDKLRMSYENAYSLINPVANMKAIIKDLKNESELSRKSNTKTEEEKSEKTDEKRNETVEKDHESKEKTKTVNDGWLFGTLNQVLSPLDLESTTKRKSESKYTEKNTVQIENQLDIISSIKNEISTSEKTNEEISQYSIETTMENKKFVDLLEKTEQQLRRVDEFESTGMWACSAYFLAEDPYIAEQAAGIYKSLMIGGKTTEVFAVNFWEKQCNEEKFQNLVAHVSHMHHPQFVDVMYKRCYTPASFVTGQEVAIHMGLPRSPVQGLPVLERADFGLEVVYHDGDSPSCDDLLLGHAYADAANKKTEIRLRQKDMTAHTFVTGTTRVGKSYTVFVLLDELKIKSKPFLVIEPTKGEYKHHFNVHDVSVYGTSPKYKKTLKINPFRFDPKQKHVIEHIEKLVELISGCWELYAAMPAILKNAFEKAYEASGWDLEENTNIDCNIYPTFGDVLRQVEVILNMSKYGDEVRGNYEGALCERLKLLTGGIAGMVFACDDTPDMCLFDRNSIVDLSDGISSETRALLMGLIIMRLRDYKEQQGFKKNLEHITVLEEAHLLLKASPTNQSTENANITGKSVEMLVNSIAEMGAYGEGFIISDNMPDMLDRVVLGNTNTKIMFRLPEYNARAMVGKAIGLNEVQIDGLAKLENQVAAVYQSNWIEPVLVKVKVRDDDDKNKMEYKFEPSLSIKPRNNVCRRHLINLLAQGWIEGHLQVNNEKVKEAFKKLDINGEYKLLLKKCFEKYNGKGKLLERRSLLNKMVTEVMGCRDSFGRAVNKLYELHGSDTVIYDAIRSETKKTAVKMLEEPSDIGLGALHKNLVKFIEKCLMDNYFESSPPGESIEQRVLKKTSWAKNFVEGRSRPDGD